MPPSIHASFCPWLFLLTPRGRCESSVAARGRQCQLSISTPPSPLHAHGLACQDAGSCTGYAAYAKPFCTVRWTGRGSPVPGLNHRRCFNDACITALNFSLNLALFSSAQGKLLQAPWAAADPSCKSPGTRAPALSPGSEHQSIACKLLGKETARGSEVARCNYKRGRLHSLMNQLN